MNSFTMLTKESSETLSREQLVSMYNDAVEMIWFLESRVRQLSEFQKRMTLFGNLMKSSADSTSADIF